MTSKRRLHLSTLANLIICFYLLIRSVLGDFFSPMACIANFIPLLLVPLAITTIYSAIQRRYLGLLAGIIGISAIFFRIAPRLTSGSNCHQNYHPAGQSELRTITHNVGQSLSSVSQLVELVQQNSPDIVFLQELPHEYYVELSIKLADLGLEATVFSSQHEGTDLGLAVFSRYQILEWEKIRLTPASIVEQLYVTIQSPIGPLVLYSVHLTYPNLYFTKEPPWLIYNDEPRKLEISQLLQHIIHEQRPMLLAGDFNLSEYSDDYIRLITNVGDSYADGGNGLGFTWPANNTPSISIPIKVPIVRIDYIFYSRRKFTVKCASVLNMTGSDHLPLRVDFELYK